MSIEQDFGITQDVRFEENVVMPRVHSWDYWIDVSSQISRAPTIATASEAYRLVAHVLRGKITEVMAEVVVDSFDDDTTLSDARSPMAALGRRLARQTLASIGASLSVAAETSDIDDRRARVLSVLYADTMDAGSPASAYASALVERVMARVEHNITSVVLTVDEYGPEPKAEHTLEVYSVAAGIAMYLSVAVRREREQRVWAYENRKIVYTNTQSPEVIQ